MSQRKEGRNVSDSYRHFRHLGSVFQMTLTPEQRKAAAKRKYKAANAKYTAVPGKEKGEKGNGAMGWDRYAEGEDRGYVPMEHINRVNGGMGDGCRRILPRKGNT